jgi:hypothetical protein
VHGMGCRVGGLANPSLALIQCRQHYEPNALHLVPYTFFMGYVGVERMAAALPFGGGKRKVRAPQDRVLGNAQSRRREGKCHRKETALSDIYNIRQGKGERVR